MKSSKGIISSVYYKQKPWKVILDKIHTIYEKTYSNKKPRYSMTSYKAIF